jgi:hypothetical protein
MWVNPLGSDIFKVKITVGVKKAKRYMINLTPRHLTKQCQFELTHGLSFFKPSLKKDVILSTDHRFKIRIDSYSLQIKIVEDSSIDDSGFKIFIMNLSPRTICKLCGEE